ncbi:pericentriolar material 1 protein isoform X3 [Pseudophryne corroboree]|uniref:pericentriolar material 1 protein isoform X3 n=1 Tax=Pseudophryne corroboree TaxID=495146 RepID=UPI003081C4B0
MATGGGTPEEGVIDQDLPNWSHESLDDRLNNMDWSGQKKANRSSEKNKKKFGMECETRLTNDISPGSSPGVGRRRTRTPHTFPHTRYMSQMSVPEQAELERLKQKINFGDLDQRSIGSDSQGRATAANNKRQPAENRKPFNFLPLQLNTNRDKAASSSPPKRESGVFSLPKDFLASALTKDLLQNYQASLEEDGGGEPAFDSSQVVSKLVKIRNYITKASSLRDDLVEKNERSANVERLSNLIHHLKAQEKCYLNFLQKLLASDNEEDVRTIESAVGSGSVAESTSLNIDVQSEASDTTGIDPQQEAKEELKNMKKQHALLTRMLQQQEQLRALKGRQAALLALQQKAEQAIAVMDESVVTETTGSVSGLSLTSELNEELNDLIQRFHNQLHDVQSPPVPDNRRQAESLSLAKEVCRSVNSSVSEPVSEERGPLLSNVGAQLGKRQKMDSMLGELHTMQDHHLNNTTCSPQRVLDQRSIGSSASAPPAFDNRAPNSPGTAAPYPSATFMNDSDDEENQNPAEKLKKLKEVRKRLNELRDLVRYYEQTSDMMTDAVNENIKDDEEEETEDSWVESDQEVNQPVINIRNPQHLSSWGPVNSITNSQCGTNNRDERPLNTDCEINNRSAANLRSFNASSALDCLYNRETEDKGRDVELEEEDDDDVEEDQESAVSLSSRSSVSEDARHDEFEEKFNRLIAAKQKLRQLQELVVMYGDDTESETIPADRSASDSHHLLEEADTKQQPNNTRPNASKAQRDVALKEQAREKFYESKLQQQQQELKQLQEERKKLIEIQEKIQTLRKACPDLQLSTSSVGTCPTTRQMPTAASTPDINESSTAVMPSMPDPEDSSSVDNEVWSEIRRHQILREDLRQRRKQLETLMAEHQKRQGLTETTSAGSLRSDDSETQGLQHQSKTEKTMATWGGSTQCALDEDDGCISDINQAEEEEEEEDEDEDNTFHENTAFRQGSMNRSAFSGKSSKQGWKSQCTYSVDGNYRPSPKARQQQNISMRRQENLRWVSELSQVEEKEHWQEQINQLKKQLEFSTNICQTLMRDQQSLSYLLQSMVTNPYSVMPSNVGTPQVHLIMHQLNQCYTQLTWQQSNVLRLKQMLNDVMQQQQEHMQQNSQERKDRGSNVPPPSSPNVFNNFSFLPPPMNVFNMPTFGSIPHMVPGLNFNPVFQAGIGNFTHNSAPQPDIPLQSHDPNTSGKTEYMAFPKPFESNSSNTADKQRNSPKTDDEGEHSRSVWLQNQNKDQGKKSSVIDAGHSGLGGSQKQPEGALRVGQFDEESLESLSSMPDPVDPTTVMKMFKSRKSSAQASLASKDKTPKTKNKKRKIAHQKNRGLKNLDLHASVTSNADSTARSSKHAQTEETAVGIPITIEHIQRLKKDTKAADISSEAGSDFSVFEAMRDTIYSEVATLISQNECRPHFLIELFHELQLLNTDYLRQKALFALQDIVTRRLAESTDKKQDCSKPLESAGWMSSNSELTPSESLSTTDDEMFAKNSVGPVCNLDEQNDADNISTLSTSSNFEPFATDDLDMGEKRSDDGSAVPCPRIDTQQLDRQIKAIMKEVIPFLKEHMEEVCSSHLLTSIRRMVLTLTQQNDESKEFVKFFHKQLGSILQDSLAKFSNRKLKDCGEDLLVDISEVLFNELAFFRLMQDMDNTSSTVPGRSQPKSEDDLQSFTKEAQKMFVGEESSDPQEIDDEDKDKDETETAAKIQNKNINVSGVQSGRSDISEEEDGNENTPVSFSLSKAETQALTNYGSGEDENEEEENEEFETGPVDVQTSLEASTETADANEKDKTLKNTLKDAIECDKTAVVTQQEAGEALTAEEEQRGAPANSSSDSMSAQLILNKESDLPASVDVDTKPPLMSAESSGPGSPASDSPVLVNEYESGSGNLSQKSDEDDFVKVEDLPLTLTIPKADLMAEMEKEGLRNNLCDEILNGQGNGAVELAGDDLSLKEPESFGSHSA